MEIDIGMPTPRQIEFFKANKRFVAYGGARGGGKSWALRRKLLLLGCRYSGIKMLLIRRTYPELRENHILPLIAELKGLASYREIDKSFTFLNGSRLVLGYCATEADVLQYQGQDYDVICIDEATQQTESQFQALTACLRGANNFPKRFYLTCNPGGIGHAWVKRLFIDCNYRRGEKAEDYVFIPASVYDNPHITNNDSGYVRMLEALPETQREAWLNGNWDIFEGQAFSEWRNDPEHYLDQRWTHVIDQFNIPDYWHIYRCFDFGYTKPFAVEWLAADSDEKLYLIHEWYGSSEADTGIKLTPAEIAEGIRKIEDTHPNIKGHTVIGVADPAIFAEQSGESIASIMCKRPYNIYFGKADNTRIAGKMQFHYRLAFDERGKPLFQAFNTCRGFIRTFPTLIYDAKKLEDVDTTGEDHCYDAVRYGLMERPISPRQIETKKVNEFDPLDLNEKPNKYSFMKY